MINPKGYVPALELDNGEILTENAVILQFIADQKPASHLLAKEGSFERVRTLEWLNFIATEVHKCFKPLFSSDAPEETKKTAKDDLKKRFKFANETLSNQRLSFWQPFLCGRYLFICDAQVGTEIFFGLKRLPSSTQVS